MMSKIQLVVTRLKKERTYGVLYTQIKLQWYKKSRKFFTRDSCGLRYAAGRLPDTTKRKPQWYEKYSEISLHVVVVDSHIQRIVLATEETTVTQQVSHRPIKRQSRLWSQRGTKVNGSHHGDNPLLRPTGIQIATKSYAALQAMAPTNIKTVHQTSLLYSRATSIDSECCRLPTTNVLSKKPEKLRSNQF